MKKIGLIIFLLGIFVLGAMEPTKGTAAEQLQSLIAQKLPLELQFTILDKMMALPFPTSNQGVFAQNYLNFLMSTYANLTLKKMYLNKFAKKWNLNYGK